MEDIFRYIEPTEEQQAILDKAMELLSPFADKAETSNTLTYFTIGEDGDEYSSEYDCCGDEDCIEYAKGQIRNEYGEDEPICECGTYASGDHENFNTCCKCGAFFNETLTWVKWELDYLDICDDYESITDTHYAFILRGIYDSIPSNDYDISEYAKHQYRIGNHKPLEQTKEWQRELIEKVVKHAQFVIDEFAKKSSNT